MRKAHVTLVRGHNLMSRLRPSSTEYIQDYTQLDWAADYIFNDIKTNLGQTFYLTSQNELYVQGYEFSGAQISRINARCSTSLYRTMSSFFFTKYFFKEEKKIDQRKLSLPFDFPIKSICTGLGNLSILDSVGNIWVLGDNFNFNLGCIDEESLASFVKMSFSDRVLQIDMSSKTAACLTGDVTS